MRSSLATSGIREPRHPAGALASRALIARGSAAWGLAAWALTLVGLAPAAMARWVDLGGGPTDVRVIEDSGDRIVVELRVGGFEVEPIEMDGCTRHRILLEGEPEAHEPGRPGLPRVRRSLVLPGDRRMTLRVLEAESVELPDLAPTPAAALRGRDDTEPPRDVQTAPDRWPGGPGATGSGPGSGSGSDALYPETIAELGEPYILRDVRGAVLELRPFQCAPDASRLRVHRRVRVELTDAGPDTRNVLPAAAEGQPLDPQFARLYRDHFLNFDPSRYAPVPEEGGLLILAYDPFVPLCEPLRDWKLQKGLPVTLAPLSAAGTTPEEVLAYIRQAYEQSGIAYALLVGDAEQLPTFLLYDSGADPLYALLAGDDPYPEIFVGRFSAETADQVATQVERTVAYERDLTGEDEWLAYATGIASNEGPGHLGEYDNEHMDLIRRDLLAYGYEEVDRIYQPDGTAALVTAAVEAGRGLINYTGHGTATGWGSWLAGWEVFSIEDVDALANTGRLPFIDTVGCDAGHFNGMTCFAEAWLRATHAGRPAGAVAAYMSTVSQYWSPPMDAQDEFVDLLAADSLRTAGGLWFNGSCRMIDLHGEPGALMFKTWTIFGDPSLALRTRRPTPLALTHPGALALGDSIYPVTAAESPGALCALSADGVLYGSAAAGADGRALIALDLLPLEPTLLTLTVTAANRITAREPVEVLLGQEARLVVRDLALADEPGDGQADAGERIDLRIELCNVGGLPTGPLSARIVRQSEPIAVEIGEVACPPLGPGESIWSPDPFVLRLSRTLADGEVLELELAIAEQRGRDVGAGHTAFVAHAPRPEAGDVAVDDSVAAAGNAHLDPGETARLLVNLVNPGSGYLRDARAVLRCSHPLVAVLAESAAVTLLAPGGAAPVTPAFEIAIDAAYDLPYADLHLELTDAAGTPVTLEIALPVGGFWDPMEGDNSLFSHGPVTPGYLDQWHLSVEDNHTLGGGHCWKCGPPGAGSYAALLDAALISEPVELSGRGELRCWMRIEAQESSIYAGKAYDGGRVELSLNGGDWQVIEPEGGYPYTMMPSQTNPFSFNTPAFSGVSGWQPAVFDLSGFVGPARIRFRFGSDEGEGLRGWFIDDVEITGLGGFAAAPTEPPAEHRLALGGPSPFRASTRIDFVLADAGPARLELFDIAGRHIRTLVDARLPAGPHAVTWSGRDQRENPVAAGCYLARLRQDNRTSTLRLLRLP